MSNDAINTSYNPTSLDHIFEDVDPPSEWIHEKENPLLDGAGLFLVDTSDDEIAIVDQSQQQNLSDSSSSATSTQSGGGLSPIYDDDRENGDGGEIISTRRHGENMRLVMLVDIFVTG
ncbi:hypothetical protein V6N11_033972 [Hibiscus sabdariffa]|uniref:Uncharacterized protein n=1 Tax=Hibiscus sabdariffa TaxID=183260 RepID=A0ABR2S141_9ROSI